MDFWTTYREEQGRSRQTGNQEQRQRAEAALRQLYAQLEAGNYDRNCFAEYKDSAVQGGYSDYPSNPHDALFIKKVRIAEAEQAYLDSEFAQANGFPFICASVGDLVRYDHDHTITVSQMIAAPPISEIFEILRRQIQVGDCRAMNIVSMLVEKNLSDLVVWQKEFHRAVPKEIVKCKKNPQVIIERYMSNIRQAVENAEQFTIALENQSLLVSDEEWALLNLSLQRYKQLNFAGHYIARIRDNTEANSGLRLGKRRFTESDYRMLVDVLSDSSGHLSKERVADRYVHWDTSAFHFGHFLEDFWRIVSADSLRGLPPSQTETWLRFFLQEKFGHTAREQNIRTENALVGFFRNLRHRDVVITTFAKINEQRYEAQAKTERERNSWRAKYRRMAAHYLSAAQASVVDCLHRNCRNDATISDEAYQMWTWFGRTQATLACETSSVDWQRQLQRYAHEIVCRANGTSCQEVRELAQCYGLSYIAQKMARFSEIQFGRLLTP